MWKCSSCLLVQFLEGLYIWQQPERYSNLSRTTLTSAISSKNVKVLGAGKVAGGNGKIWKCTRIAVCGNDKMKLFRGFFLIIMLKAALWVFIIWKGEKSNFHCNNGKFFIALGIWLWLLLFIVLWGSVCFSLLLGYDFSQRERVHSFF